MIIASALALLAAPLPTEVADQPRPGRILMQADGKPIARIWRVQADGSVVVIVNEKFKTIPASTLTVQGGKVTTTLSKRDVSRM